MDKSNGYEDIAPLFLKSRGIAVNGIGKSSVLKWAQTLHPGSVILDIGCGTGIPVSQVLIDKGMVVYGIDASPTLANAFHQNFPDSIVACEAAEDSNFFDRQFDGIISIGLIFLLPEQSQLMLIKKMSTALKTGGKLLFSATQDANTWNDGMTDEVSISFGANKYKELLSESGLSMVDDWADEGGNYHFSAEKI